MLSASNLLQFVASININMHWTLVFIFIKSITGYEAYWDSFCASPQARVHEYNEMSYTIYHFRTLEHERHRYLYRYIYKVLVRSIFILINWFNTNALCFTSVPFKRTVWLFWKDSWCKTSSWRAESFCSRIKEKKKGGKIMIGKDDKEHN